MTAGGVARFFCPWCHAPPPRWAQDLWDRFPDHLRKDDPNWQFWIDFYDTILRGESYSPDYIALLDDITQRDDAFWKRDAAAINADIASVYRAYQNQTAQHSPTPSHSERQKQHLTSHIRMLLLEPVETAQNVKELSEKMKAAISETKQNINDHEGLELLDAVAEKFETISQVIHKDDSASTFQDEILGLKAENQALRDKIKTLEDAVVKLEEKLKAVENALQDKDNPSVRKSLATAFDKFVTGFAEEGGKAAGRTAGTMVPILATYLVLGDPAIVIDLAGAAAQFLAKERSKG